MDCLGSVTSNKYAEGYPGARYYGGCEVVDKIEQLAIDRALQAFHLDANEWGVNVQPLSGSPANFEVYTALIKPGDKIMGLSLAHGGHLTHGHKTKDKAVSATALYFQSCHYHVDANTGLIDYEEMEKIALEEKPQIIVAGLSAYPRELDYPKFRALADKVGAYLMADMAHISGLVAAQEQNNPFELCDVVTTTTHKSLRGPRGGIIFYKLAHKKAIDFSVFPML